MVWGSSGGSGIEPSLFVPLEREGSTAMNRNNSLNALSECVR